MVLPEVKWDVFMSDLDDPLEKPEWLGCGSWTQAVEFVQGLVDLKRKVGWHD